MLCDLKQMLSMSPTSLNTVKVSENGAMWPMCENGFRMTRHCWSVDTFWTGKVLKQYNCAWPSKKKSYKSLSICFWLETLTVPSTCSLKYLYTLERVSHAGPCNLNITWRNTQHLTTCEHVVLLIVKTCSRQCRIQKWANKLACRSQFENRNTRITMLL